MTKEPYVYSNSASQVENFHTCNRKWFLDSVMRLKQPPAGSAVLGTALHAISDAWLKFGIEPSGSECVEWTTQNKAKTQTYHHKKYPGRIFQNGVHLLPPPRTALVEGRFTVVTPEGRTFKGASDQIYTDPDQVAVVGDNKTCGTAMYALTEPELLVNVQFNTYAWRAISQWRLDVVRGSWVYFLTDEAPNPPKKEFSTREQRAKWAAWVKAGRLLAWRVTTTVTRDHVLEQMASIDATAAKMDKIRLTVTNSLDVEPNLNGCGAYGGCPHRNTERCSLTVGQVYDRLQTREDIKTMAISDLQGTMKAQQDALAAQNPGAVVPSPVSAPPPVVESAKVWALGDPLNQTQAMKAGLRKPLMAVALDADNPPELDVIMSWPDYKAPYQDALQAKVARENPPPPPVVATDVPPPPVTGTPIGVPEAGRINPPVAQGGAAVAAASPEHLQALAPPVVGVPAINLGVAAAFDDRKAIKTELERYGAKDAAGKPITQSSSHSTATLVELLTAARAAAGVGAPAPVANVPPAPVTVPLPPGGFAAPYPPVAGVADLAATIAAAYPATPPPPSRGFRLCVNTIPGRAHDSFSTIAAYAMARFREKHDAVHYRGYAHGAGPGIFASYVEAYLVEGPGVPSGVLFVDARSGEGQDALATLERLATEVDRGI